MSYIGQTLPADTFQGFTTDSFTGDGSATTFTLSKAPFSENGLIVVINNVIQKPTTNFTVSGTTLTIVGTAVASGDVIYATHLSGVIPSTLASKLDTNGVSDALILDADADTTISADTDDQIDIKIGGSDIFQMTASKLDLNGKELVLDADADTSITADTDDQIDFKIGGSDKLSISSAGTLSLTSGNLEMDDTQELRLGTGNDFALNFDGTNSIIDHTPGSGALFLRSDAIILQDSQSTPNTYFRIDQGSQAKAIIPTHNYFAFKVEHTGDPSSAAPYGLEIAYSGGAPDSNSDTANIFINCTDTGATRFRVSGDGDVQNHDNDYGTVSDERIKTNIVDANSQWDDIKALKVRNFERKDDVAAYGEGKKVQIGLIAQECEAVSPKLVKESEPTAEDIKVSSEFGTLNEDGTIKTTTDEKVKGISYSVLYMKAIKALQEAMAKIETLETKVKALEDA